MVKRKVQVEHEQVAPAAKVRRTESRATALSSKTSQAKSSDTTKPPDDKLKGKATTIQLNSAPSERLDVYVFGGNSAGELGLGPDASNRNVARPRLNQRLLLDSVGVVRLATGGMHCIALTHDNKLLTWGVNDHGALGRDTTWSGGLVDADAGDEGQDSDDEDGKLNPLESTPTSVDLQTITEGTIWTDIAASDSASFAVTTDGLVYGWGTFKATDGSHAFALDIQTQSQPVVIPGLKNIKAIAAGTNHVLALTSTGTVLSWGFGEQSQLGRRVLSRSPLSGLVPRPLGLAKIAFIGCGSDHSFAISQIGQVYGWGANNYGQTGVSDNLGEENVPVDRPSLIHTLIDVKNVVQITGGNHHSIALTAEGVCLTWGRVENHALGLEINTLKSEDTIRDARDRPRILTKPVQLPELDITYVAAGSDHCVVITKQGQGYTWGFSENMQTGQGMDEDIERPMLLDNTAVKGKRLVWAGAGGQFSMVAGLGPQVNGTT